MGSYVIVTKANNRDYLKDYVALPKDYGKSSYFSRPDIQDIYEVVYRNLDALDAHTKFTNEMKNRHVIIKPNLVSVFYKIGFKDDAYPESTDPRVIDAVISYVKKYTNQITLVESSGRGMPTRTSFKVAGIDRLARFHQIQLIPLEEEPVERYLLPKAQIMNEMMVPRILTQVIRQEAYYISIPKMKTNLYTGVTLGFKNAMGSIPYNLRQRNHNYHINKKLVDILYCYKPNLVIIDGIIGGEGNTPAPVDPVRSHVIISGNNSVETDWVGTKFMGIDPESIELLTEAKRLGFGDKEVKVIGEIEPVPFRKADQTLLSAYFRTQFPNVRYFVGHSLKHSKQFDSIDEIDQNIVKLIEKECVGGCLAAMRQGFEMFFYEGLNNSFPLAVVIGSGTVVDGKPVYFDVDGKSYSSEDILKLDMKVLAFGSCTKAFVGTKALQINGCMPMPTASLKALHKLTGQTNRLYSTKNKQLLKLGLGALKMRHNRISMTKKGLWMDVLPSYSDDRIHKFEDISESQKSLDYIHAPLPPLEGEAKKTLLRDVRRNSF